MGNVIVIAGMTEKYEARSQSLLRYYESNALTAKVRMLFFPTFFFQKEDIVN